MTWEELITLLKTATDADMIDVHRDDLAAYMPEIRTMFDYDQKNHYHPYDLWMHSLHTVLDIPRGLDDDMLYLGALLHDVAKPLCACRGVSEEDTDMHYYGHPGVGADYVRDVILPGLKEKGIVFCQEDVDRLLYYIRYHDDIIELDIKDLKRHLELTDLNTFKKLMLLKVADAKAHLICPPVQRRIDICSKWATDYADLKAKEL